MKIRWLGQQAYEPILYSMKTWTEQRHEDTEDELWLLEHPPVYTQGQAGRAEHIIAPGKIPIIQSDRGGQITYHGPGQLIIYVLLNLKRRHLGIKTLVCQLEKALIEVLSNFDIQGVTQCGAPGIYVDSKKIASLGLRVKQHCTYHGIALNVDMDLTPFSGIQPCGYPTLMMTQMKHYIPNIQLSDVQDNVMYVFNKNFGA